jgi:hypothetical protein
MLMSGASAWLEARTGKGIKDAVIKKAAATPAVRRKIELITLLLEGRSPLSGIELFEKWTNSSRRFPWRQPILDKEPFKTGFNVFNSGFVPL